MRLQLRMTLSSRGLPEPCGDTYRMVRFDSLHKGQIFKYGEGEYVVTGRPGEARDSIMEGLRAFSPDTKVKVFRHTRW